VRRECPMRRERGRGRSILSCRAKGKRKGGRTTFSNQLLKDKRTMGPESGIKEEREGGGSSLYY